MTQETATPKKSAPAASEDLSRAIEETMARQPDEQVRTVRLFNDYYRCNWWVIDKLGSAPWISSGKIRKSRFLKATRAAEGLLIEDTKQSQ